MSKLFVVPTPIGNLKDITYRAIETLKEVDLILCEDTRVSAKLLNHYEISKPLKSYHLHNEHKKVEEYTDLVQNSVNGVALVSDAGTPAISDPGYLLVRNCIKNNIEVEALPGATAFIPAMVVSGFPTDTFYFEGFLPQKKGRKTKLEELANINKTIALYESPYRIIKLLTEINEYFREDVQVSVSREITKKFESHYRGSALIVKKLLNADITKGEFVVVIDNK